MSWPIPLIHTQTIVVAYFVSYVSHNETLAQAAWQPWTACYLSCLVMCALSH
ncbi:hypothetical protein COCSADRAFT_250853 [Bipolaris sorokiniana ND90Pr]|uniref:Uncharacterized protein n=1 Tax=Cochliobolus sativus (strain ND90Pr / ATCC 201652) TaxID=665912 RepID=M2SRT6_COCSN|nr:uncharacterized protein COCSADRAFT_250853 [Bipolaris sorokiniana ND90Pr]EMD59517.1 hypothetical protein COCSADRAFT_250853 [Bipolaris sorokiniana ND90Pr]